MNLKNFNDKHKGDVIFILGNGEELKHLSKEHLSFLSNKTTIGVNYAHLVHTPNYMITGHFSQVLYADEFSNIPFIFFQAIDNFYENFEINNLIKVHVKYFYNNTSIKVLKEVDDKNNYLVGAANILISATNLAYIMGSKKIVFIGFNQRNRLHFYDIDENMKKNIKENIGIIKNKYNGNKWFDEINKDFDLFIKNMLPEENLRGINFFDPDTSVGIKKIFEIIKNNGVELISTEKDSRLVDCGATYKSIDDVFDDLIKK